MKRYVASVQQVNEKVRTHLMEPYGNSAIAAIAEEGVGPK